MKVRCFLLFFRSPRKPYFTNPHAFTHMCTAQFHSPLTYHTNPHMFTCTCMAQFHSPLTPHKSTHVHTHVHGSILLTAHTAQAHTHSYTTHTSSHMHPLFLKVPHTCTYHFIHHLHLAHVGTTHNSMGTTWVYLPCHPPHIFSLHSLASPQAPQAYT